MELSTVDRRKGNRMTRLIDADVLKGKTCDGGVCSDCGKFWNGKNVQANCSEIRWYFLNVIDEQPTVDAIPVEWIQIKIEMLDKQNAEPPGMTLRLLVRQWYAEQEKDNEM